MYAPRWDRFLQVDPIGYQGGSNLYTYVGNDPLNFIDPFGLDKQGGFSGYSAQLAAPELAQSQALTDFVQQYPRATMVEGAIGLGVVFGGTGLGALADIVGVAGLAPAARSIGSIGEAGEEAAGIATGVPKVAIRIPGSTTIRFPDELTATTLTELKNVVRLSLTQQIQDYLGFAQSTDRTFNLYVRPTTHLTGPLRDAISTGQINLRFLPPP
jgi:hypothetical protein